jgi:hypothetical protein
MEAKKVWFFKALNENKEELEQGQQVGVKYESRRLEGGEECVVLHSSK